MTTPSKPKKAPSKATATKPRAPRPPKPGIPEPIQGPIPVPPEPVVIEPAVPEPSPEDKKLAEFKNLMAHGHTARFAATKLGLTDAQKIRFIQLS